jgi:hypothetical protein
MLINQLLITFGAAGLVICIASLIALHLLPTGYHPFHDPVSNYAISRYGYLYRIQAFSSGICGACLWGWFARSGINLPAWGTTALLFYSLSRLLIIFFPTDVKPPRTRTGTVHVILATLTFTGIAVATGTLTPSLVSLTIWSNMIWQLQSAAFLTDVSAIAFVIVYVFRPFHPIIGLVERCIYIGTLLWLAIVLGQLIQMVYQ